MAADTIIGAGLAPSPYAEVCDRVAAARDVLRSLVGALEAESKAKLSADNAIENFSYSKPEVDAYMRALSATHDAVKQARAFLEGQ